MRLYEADGHLEAARLYLARGEREAAQGSLAQAKAMIQETGYGRRDGCCSSACFGLQSSWNWFN